MKICICDDSLSAATIVQGSVRDFLQLRGIHPCIDIVTNGEDLDEKLGEGAYDLLLLDIQLQEADGIAIGLRLRQQGFTGDIIFVSNREDRVFEALRVQPFGFIRKSCFVQDIQDILTLYLNREQRSSRINLRSRSGIITVQAEDILSIEGAGHYQSVWLRDRAEPIEISDGMGRLEETLEPCGFLRIHKGYLVNFRFIQRIGNSDVLLSTGQELPLSRQKKTQLKERYMELCYRLR